MGLYPSFSALGVFQVFVPAICRSCHALGLTPVIVYTEPDALSLHVLEAEIKCCLGPSSRDYTNAQKLLEVAKAERYAMMSWIIHRWMQHTYCAVHFVVQFLL